VVKNSEIGVDRLRLLRTVLLAGCFGFAPLVLSTTVEAQSARSYEFSIAGQSLSAALVRYSSVTGIDIAFDGSLPSNLRTSGITGNLPAESALTKLLAGTGFTYRFTTTTTVLLINPAATSAAVTPPSIVCASMSSRDAVSPRPAARCACSPAWPTACTCRPGCACRAGLA